jgi:hypothetical protein
MINLVVDVSRKAFLVYLQPPMGKAGMTLENHESHHNE